MTTRTSRTAIERSLQNWSGRSNVSLLGRAAAGIWATLRALDYHKRIVLLPANTCYIVLWAVLHSDNIPVLVDVDPLTTNLSGETLERAGVRNAAAVIPCHMYGLPAPMAEICAWAKANNVFVIEDAALALGAQVDGQQAGSWGDVGVFSFGLGKIIDHQVGGALVTDDAPIKAEIDRLLARLPVWDDALIALTNQWHNLYWALHQYEDQNPRLLPLYSTLFEIYRPLVSYRLPAREWSGFAEEIGLLRENLAHRALMAERYDYGLHDLPLRTLPRPAGSVLWRYPLLAAPEQRNDLLAHLWENGIHDVTRWYPSLRYMTSALTPDVEQPPTPNADLLSASVINLRVDPETSPPDIDAAMGVVGKFFR